MKHIFAVIIITGAAWIMILLIASAIVQHCTAGQQVKSLSTAKQKNIKKETTDKVKAAPAVAPLRDTPEESSSGNSLKKDGTDGLSTSVGYPLVHYSSQPSDAGQNSLRYASAFQPASSHQVFVDAGAAPWYLEQPVYPQHSSYGLQYVPLPPPENHGEPMLRV
jgi:hypothetical protein